MKFKELMRPNVASFNSLGPKRHVRHFLRSAFLLSCLVLLLTQVLLAQDNKSSKIPDGEAKFTRAQLADYYLVYQNPDVRYLRTLFNNYLRGSGGSEQEHQILDKWNKAYFQSKFIVMSRDHNTFGGTLITILFQDRPDKVLVAWVYPEGKRRVLTLRGLDAGDFNDEDMRRIRVRYKKLIEDRVHAM